MEIIMSNLPKGNNSFLDNDDMICEHCGYTDDVDNGEYVKDNWYCNNCFEELFHTCKECCEVISIEEDYCEHCKGEQNESNN